MGRSSNNAARRRGASLGDFRTARSASLTHAAGRRGVATALLGAACPHASAALAAERTVALRFAGEFDGRPFDCTETYAGVGSTDSDVVVTDYRLYVSNVSLTTADGTVVPLVLNQDDVWQSGDVDPAAVLSEADLGTNAPDTAPGCMAGVDDPDCASVMPLLGLAWDGGEPSAEQRLFSVRRDAP